MAVPKHRHTKSKRNKVRMHLYAKPAFLISCQKCKAKILPHTVCQNCGYYKGKEIINVLGKLTKKDRKQKEREMAKAEKEQGESGKEKPLTMEELSKK